MRSLKVISLLLLVTAVWGQNYDNNRNQNYDNNRNQNYESNQNQNYVANQEQNYDDGSYKPELYDTSALFDDGKYRPDDGTKPSEPFEFGYNVKNNGGRNDYGHAESGDGTVTRGQYRILLPNGIVQVVNYQADKEHGFQPEITYERPAAAATRR